MRRLLVWCAGASPELLSKCPVSDTIRQTLIGTFVLLTGVIAGLGSFYAFLSTTRSVVFAVPCALLWAMMIFTLDRLVITTMSPRQRGNVYAVPAWQALPRALLAALLGITVSLPVELFIFRDEIVQARVAQHLLRLDEYRSADANALAVRAQHARQTCDHASGGRQIEALQRQMDHLQLRIDSTILGTDGTRPTCKTVCQDLMNQQERIRQQHAALKKPWEACYAAQLAAGDPDQAQTAATRRVLREQVEKSVLEPSFLTQYKTFRALSGNNEELARASFFLPLLFVFFELVPVLAKLLAGVSSYELLVHRERMEALDLAKEHALSLETAERHRLEECSRNQELLSHQRSVAADLQKRMAEETAAQFLSRFRAILPAFDGVPAVPAAGSRLTQAIHDFLLRKIEALIALTPPELPATFAAAQQVRTRMQVPPPAEAPRRDDAPPPAASAAPPAAASPSGASAAAASRRTEEYTQSFVKKALESMAARVPDLIGYAFTNSVVFVTAFPAVMVSVYAFTGSFMVAFPCLLVAFVVGRRMAKASASPALA